MDIITLGDVDSFASSVDTGLLQVMVAGANARAVRVAPCLAASDNPAARAEAKLILIGAVKRWVEAGSGAVAQASAGPFQLSTDTRQRTGFNLWPSEIEVLQDLCSKDAGGAFGVDTGPTSGSVFHDEACTVVFGASYCSCGAVLTGGEPLWPSP